jgi:hypothetical protein
LGGGECAGPSPSCIELVRDGVREEGLLWGWLSPIICWEPNAGADCVDAILAVMDARRCGVDAAEGIPDIAPIVEQGVRPGGYVVRNR